MLLLPTAELPGEGSAPQAGVLLTRRAHAYGFCCCFSRKLLYIQAVLGLSPPSVNKQCTVKRLTAVSLSTRACFCSAIDPYRIPHRKRGAQCEAVQSRSLEIIVCYGFIIESTQQQYELKAIPVLFPPSPGCHSCTDTSLVLTQLFEGGHAVFFV